MICINCPKGCRLEARKKDDEWIVTGNECPRGKTYALQEMTDPQRVLTALMRPLDSDRPVSIKTDKTVPKAKLMECVKEIYKTHPRLPICAGDVLIKDLCGTGAKVVATRSMESCGK